MSHTFKWVTPIIIIVRFIRPRVRNFMHRKKILHLITGLEVGGAETMLLKTLPLLQKNFDNTLCCIRGTGPIGHELEKKGIPVYYLKLSPFNFPLVVVKFGTVIRDFHPDLLVTYLIHADLFGRVFGKIFGVKKIICNQRGFYLNWKFLRFFDRLTKALVTQYFVQTLHARDTLMHTLNLPAKKFSIVPNAINLQEFGAPFDKNQKILSLDIPKENINIVCVSNLKPRKGYEELFEAFEQVYTTFKNINLLIVGSGNQREKYSEQIKGYTSRNNIFFLGRRTDVNEVLRMSDIFVLGTYSEGMSNALLEAMAAKLAIITTNIEVNQEIIQDNYSGFLVPIQNASAIAEKLRILTLDREKREFFGKNAYDKVSEAFEIKKNITLITTVYKEILL